MFANKVKLRMFILNILLSKRAYWIQQDEKARANITLFIFLLELSLLDNDCRIKGQEQFQSNGPYVLKRIAVSHMCEDQDVRKHDIRFL